VNGRLSIGRPTALLAIELEDVDVTANGRTVVNVKDLGLNYNAFSPIAVTWCSTRSGRSADPLVEKTAEDGTRRT
jgi:hypothetical protein